MTTNAATHNLPAILGGVPTVPEGPPEWPIDDSAVREVLLQAAAERWWGKYHGPHAERLSQLLSDLHDGSHAILCCSGTAAVELALRGLQVGPGDEVILAAYDFKGNFQDVLAIGAVPVLVDLLPDRPSLNPVLLEAAFTGRTKAVIASHLHGATPDLPAITEIAARHGVPVLEDACQSPGARVHGRIAGTWGDAAVHSFGGSKLLTAGRGGAIVTRDADIAQRIRLHTQRGNDAYPLTELQAAILAPQVERLAGRNAQRAQAISRIQPRLTPIPGLQIVHNPPSDSSPAYYKVGLYYDPSHFDGLPRDAFAAAVRAEGVALDAGFRALHLTHSRRRFRTVGDLPNADAADRNLLTLHHPVLLADDAAIDAVAAAIKRVQEFAARIRQEAEHR